MFFSHSVPLFFWRRALILGLCYTLDIWYFFFLCSWYAFYWIFLGTAFLDERVCICVSVWFGGGAIWESSFTEGFPHLVTVTRHKIWSFFLLFCSLSISDVWGFFIFCFFLFCFLPFRVWITFVTWFQIAYILRGFLGSINSTFKFIKHFFKPDSQEPNCLFWLPLVLNEEFLEHFYYHSLSIC